MNDKKKKLNKSKPDVPEEIEAPRLIVAIESYSPPKKTSKNKPLNG